MNIKLIKVDFDYKMPYYIGKCIKQLSDVNIGEYQVIPRIFFSPEYFDAYLLSRADDEYYEFTESDYEFFVNQCNKNGQIPIVIYDYKIEKQ